jgi:hypothetical protein
MHWYKRVCHVVLILQKRVDDAQLYHGLRALLS